VTTALAQARSALDPAVGVRLRAFRTAVRAFHAAPVQPRTIAVVGLDPGAGRSTVTAMLALLAAGFSGRRVVVIDTATPTAGPRSAPGAMPATDDAAARTVTALLGGDVLQGRLPRLVEAAASGGVPRRLITAALTPDAALPVLSLPPGPGGFAPQLLERALERLAFRADLILVDTPVGPRAPVLHGVLDLADHFLLVVRGDADLSRQAAAGRAWLATAPGLPRHRPSSLVVVSRGLRAARPGPALTEGGPVTVLRRDEALRRRRPEAMSRSSVITGLRLATRLLSPFPSGL
jgi:hypothetical protein